MFSSTSRVSSVAFGCFAAVLVQLVATPGAAAQSTVLGVVTPGPGGSAWMLDDPATPALPDGVFTFGPVGATPLVGNWDGFSIDPVLPDPTPGLYDPATGTFFLRNTNSGGPADLIFQFGPIGIVPLAGDWDGNGTDTIGLYIPATGAFFLKNTNAPGAADITFTFGVSGSNLVPLAGDWDGDSRDTVGLYDPATGAFFLKNSNTDGPADQSFQFGPQGNGVRPIVGDWDGDGTDTVGIYLPSTGTFFLRNSNSAGAPDAVVTFPITGGLPVAGSSLPHHACDSIDFNCDGDIGTDSDIEGFFRCIAGACPGSPCRNDADFNNDGDIGTDADIEDFFRVLAGAPCGS